MYNFERKKKFLKFKNFIYDIMEGVGKQSNLTMDLKTHSIESYYKV